jgi:hypothetical protein
MGLLLNAEESLSYDIVYSGSRMGRTNARIGLISMVGAGRFELPTPCAQGIGA